jgi:hypothetical protein
MIIAIAEAFAKSQVKGIVLVGPPEARHSIEIITIDFEKKYPNICFLNSTVDLASPDSVEGLFNELKETVETIGEFAPSLLIILYCLLHLSRYSRKL